MRILITGSNGMLGSDLVKELASYEIAGIGKSQNRHRHISYTATDLTNRKAVLKSIESLQPAVIIHAAAFTDVDGCEQNPNQAFSVNVKGTEHVAEAGDAVGSTLIFISSDYVFDGTKPEPYAEEDRPNPVSVYGRTKYEAEELLKARSKSAWIIRSSWLYGANGKNFFRSIMEKASMGKELRVVQDQKGAPTYTKDLAQGIKMLIERTSRIQGFRILHLANAGQTTWFEAAQKMIRKMDPNVSVKPISSEELSRPAKRPANSALNLARIKKDLKIELRRWDEALDEFWNETLEKEWQSVTRSH
jgi:dTDP-4-dehydrorhamnose reductase